ncbi:MAG: DUF1385 domain-containing protein [Anaerolineales bacterium]
MNADKLPSYGGQALIEGVVMRGEFAVAAAMRAPDGTIVLHTEELDKIYQSKLKTIPFIRGLIVLWDALGLGMRFLVLSANVQTGEEQKLEKRELALTLLLSFVFMVLLFFWGPSELGNLVAKGFGLSDHTGILVEGLLRLFVVILYLWGIGKAPDINRVFAYHGAEHKTINAYEAGADLVPEEVAKYPLEHPRCGTSFFVTLIVLSILIFTLLGPLPFLIRLVSRVILIPLMAGIAYEYIRWTANHLSSPWIRILIKPNLWLQSLTTREPTWGMLEVSIAAFKLMLKQEIELKNKLRAT